MPAGRKRLIIEIATFAAVLVLVFVLTRRARGPQSFDEQRVQMGTLVSISVFGIEEEVANAACDVAYGEIERVAALTTRYSDGSEIETLNERGHAAVDPDVAYVVARACEVARTSHGAFDPTVAPLVDTWEFEPEMELPEHDRIVAALERVDHWSVTVDTLDSTVTLANGATLDLDGIAKGHAVDLAVEALSEMGISSAIVDAGGDIGLLGEGPRGEWRVGIKHPRVQGLVGVLRLAGGSVATSGDYQRCGFADGVRYHHILDPDTGYPARGVISATVVCERCVDADALATAVFVLGPRDGLRLVNQLDGVECVILVGEEEIEEIFVSLGLEDRFTEAE